MKRFATALALVLAGTLVAPALAGASVADKARKLSNAKYVKVVCGAYVKETELEKKFADSYSAIAADDNAGLQSQAVTITNSYLDDVRALQSKMKKVYPDIDNGKKVAKLFVNHFGSLIDEIQSALEKLQAADPSNPAFAADVTQFEVALQVVGTKLTDPFSNVHDNDLLQAFHDEKSCKDVVTIFGAD